MESHENELPQYLCFLSFRFHGKKRPKLHIFLISINKSHRENDFIKSDWNQKAFLALIAFARRVCEERGGQRESEERSNPPMTFLFFFLLFFGCNSSCINFEQLMGIPNL